MVKTDLFTTIFPSNCILLRNRTAIPVIQEHLTRIGNYRAKAPIPNCRWPVSTSRCANNRSTQPSNFPDERPKEENWTIIASLKEDMWPRKAISHPILITLIPESQALHPLRTAEQCLAFLVPDRYLFLAQLYTFCTQVCALVPLRSSMWD